MPNEGLFDIPIVRPGADHDDHRNLALFIDCSRVDQIKSAEGNPRKKHWSSGETS